MKDLLDQLGDEEKKLAAEKQKREQDNTEREKLKSEFKAAYALIEKDVIKGAFTELRSAINVQYMGKADLEAIKINGLIFGPSIGFTFDNAGYNYRVVFGENTDSRKVIVEIHVKITNALHGKIPIKREFDANGDFTKNTIAALISEAISKK